MKTVRCSFNNIHQNRKNLPRNKDDAYAHEVTERSAVPERSEVVWFSLNEVRFKGVRARPVGGAGAHAPEEVHLHERSEVLWFYHVFPISKVLWCSNKRSLVCLSFSPGSRTNFAAL